MYWLAVRQGSGLVGVLATSPLVTESDISVRQDGLVTGWVVICAELAEHGSLNAFCSWMARCSGVLSGARLGVTTPDGSYMLARGRLTHDGAQVPLDERRYDTPWVKADFDADHLTIHGRTGWLRVTRTGDRIVTDTVSPST
jgi:hypothetical protein